MKLFTLPTIFWICLICNVSFGWSADLSVRLSGDRLTLYAQNESLIAILESLVEQGVRVQIDPEINSSVTASFYNRRIDSALKSILRSFNYSLIWQNDINSTSEEPQLKEIRIFYQGQEEQVRQLVSNTNLRVTQNVDGIYYVRDILMLKLTKSITQETFDSMLNELRATVVDAHLGLGIVRLRLPPNSDVHAVADSISSYPGIEIAEPDFAYPIAGNKQILDDKSSELASLDTLPSAGKTTIAVLDSGLKTSYENNSYVLGTYDAVAPNDEVDDTLGHGTQMTLIAAGVVNPYGGESDEDATTPVVIIRAIDENGFTSNHTLLRGIDYAIENGARVLSLSWGSENHSTLLESAINYAAVKGLITVAAAGNEPTGQPVYPAAYANVIGVGALTPNGEPWVQSNYGDFVSLQAPGLANLPVGYQGAPGTYAGTSIATAYTAHRIATILDETPDADLQTILEKLVAENDIQ